MEDSYNPVAGEADRSTPELTVHSVVTQPSLLVGYQANERPCLKNRKDGREKGKEGGRKGEERRKKAKKERRKEGGEGGRGRSSSFHRQEHTHAHIHTYACRYMQK